MVHCGGKSGAESLFRGSGYCGEGGIFLRVRSEGQPGYLHQNRERQTGHLQQKPAEFRTGAVAPAGGAGASGQLCQDAPEHGGQTGPEEQPHPVRDEPLCQPRTERGSGKNPRAGRRIFGRRGRGPHHGYGQGPLGRRRLQDRRAAQGGRKRLQGRGRRAGRQAPLDQPEHLYRGHEAFRRLGKRVQENFRHRRLIPEKGGDFSPPFFSPF